MQAKILAYENATGTKGGKDMRFGTISYDGFDSYEIVSKAITQQVLISHGSAISHKSLLVYDNSTVELHHFKY